MKNKNTTVAVRKAEIEDISELQALIKEAYGYEVGQGRAVAGAVKHTIQQLKQARGNPDAKKHGFFLDEYTAS